MTHVNFLLKKKFLQIEKSNAQKFTEIANPITDLSMKSLHPHSNQPDFYEYDLIRI